MSEIDDIKERHVEVGTFYHTNNGNIFFKISDTRSVWVGNVDLDREDCEISLKDSVTVKADTDCRVFPMTHEEVNHILKEASK